MGINYITQTAFSFLTTQTAETIAYVLQLCRENWAIHTSTHLALSRGGSQSVLRIKDTKASFFAFAQCFLGKRRCIVKRPWTVVKLHEPDKKMLLLSVEGKVAKNPQILLVPNVSKRKNKQTKKLSSSSFLANFELVLFGHCLWVCKNVWVCLEVGPRAESFAMISILIKTIRAQRSRFFQRRADQWLTETTHIKAVALPELWPTHIRSKSLFSPFLPFCFRWE